MRLRFSLASRLMLLPVALLPVTADWPHAELHVMSLGEAVGHSTQLRSQLCCNTCWCAVAGAVAGAADAAGFAGTEMLCVRGAWPCSCGTANVWLICARPQNRALRRVSYAGTGDFKVSKRFSNIECSAYIRVS